MLHFSLMSGLIFVLNGAPSPGVCLRLCELPARTSVSRIELVDLVAQQNKVESSNFKDVPKGDWTYAAMDHLQRRGMITGYPLGYLSGVRILTRYEFAIPILRASAKFVPRLPRQDGQGNSVQPEIEEQAARPSAEDLKLLRKLNLEFKAQIMTLGPDWKTLDSSVQKIQDQALHKELSEALVAGLPKTEEAGPGLGSKVLSRPNWAYDALKQLVHTKQASPIPEDRLLTRAEIAAIVDSGMGDFLDNERVQEDTVPMPDPRMTPYKLTEVIALHKLLHAYRFEIALSGRDIVAVEDRLRKAEEKRIAEEEVIDTKPPVLSTREK